MFVSWSRWFAWTDSATTVWASWTVLAAVERTWFVCSATSSGWPGSVGARPSVGLNFLISISGVFVLAVILKSAPQIQYDSHLGQLISSVRVDTQYA